MNMLAAAYIEIILYVADQVRSKAFYQAIFQINPSLDVPGMTEFDLFPNCKLGLMPEEGIAKILSEKMPRPASANGIPRCELYLATEDVSGYYSRALAANALLVSDLQDRDWGHKVCYFADPDGHVIAFAQRTHSERAGNAP